ncbi:hypothetical protein ACFV3R_24975 [Streptomyces sp. NPDC059740]|uniref:hypothetical protein n=1 Tax=Streptomyces sp. NPDC059740 TaxID=3346926 RepID=UPI003653FA0A
MPDRNPQLHPTNGPIHTWFGLSYSNYAVLPRTLLQSMPTDWQQRMVACLNELDDAFQHIPQAEAYEVTAATEHIVNEMTAEELLLAGITEVWETDGEPPMPPWDEGFRDWMDTHQKAEPTYYDDAFQVMNPDQRVLLPVSDPVPHYNRGRTYIPPQQTQTQEA